MTKFYACVIGNKIVCGPGALPYRWQAPNGNPYQLLELRDFERESLGWREAIERGKRPFNPEIEQETIGRVAVENDRAIIEWVYRLVPGARERMLQQIDVRAEQMRQDASTGLPGQSWEYENAYREAVEIIAHAEDDNQITKGVFIGSLEEASDVIRAYDATLEKLGQIRRWRLDAKAQIRAAESDEAALERFQSLMG